MNSFYDRGQLDTELAFMENEVSELKLKVYRCDDPEDGGCSYCGATDGETHTPGCKVYMYDPDARLRAPIEQSPDKCTCGKSESGPNWATAPSMKMDCPVHHYLPQNGSLGDPKP